jgi:hypothetical protein
VLRLAAATVLFACNATLPTPASPPEQSEPRRAPEPMIHAIAGEHLMYVGRFRDITVGRARVAVGDAGWIDGKPAIIVRTRAQTEGAVSLVTELAYDLTTTIDLEAQRPLRTVEAWNVVFRGERDERHKERAWLDAWNQDVHSALAMARGWRSRPGDRTAMTVNFGHFELETDMWDAGREVIQTMNRPAVRYEGIVFERFPFTAWISDDADRVPLRLKADTKWGSIDVELEDYLAPAS